MLLQHKPFISQPANKYECILCSLSPQETHTVIADSIVNIRSAGPLMFECFDDDEDDGKLCTCTNDPYIYSHANKSCGDNKRAYFVKTTQLVRPKRTPATFSRRHNALGAGARKLATNDSASHRRRRRSGWLFVGARLQHSVRARGARTP